MKDGSYVELKSYDFSRPSYQSGAGVEGSLKQLDRDIQGRGAQDITVVFDTSFADMPPAFQQRLEAGINRLREKYPDKTINWGTWRRESYPDWHIKEKKEGRYEKDSICSVCDSLGRLDG